VAEGGGLLNHCRHFTTLREYEPFLHEHYTNQCLCCFRHHAGLYRYREAKLLHIVARAGERFLKPLPTADGGAGGVARGGRVEFA
jgi:hypothetical protein